VEKNRWSVLGHLVIRESLRPADFKRFATALFPEDVQLMEQEGSIGVRDA
jgi:hypothetical protein